MLVSLESDSSDDDCVAHCVGLRRIASEPSCASSLYHDDSCLSPRYVHLVSKVAGRPLGDVYQTLSFVAAYFHTVPSLHLGNVTTVDPAMMVQPERSFEAFAPSVSQLDCSRCVCCSIWRVRQMPTGSQQRVDSSTHSAQRSEPTVCHGRSGTSDGIIGSTRFCLSLEHLSHLSTKSSICLLRPGHQTDCFARYLHFVIPSCHSWIFPSIVFCMATGITRRLPLSSNPFWIVRSAATCRYSFSSDPVSLCLATRACIIPGCFDMLHHQLALA